MSERFNACEWLLDRHLEAGQRGRLALRSEGVSLSYAEVHARVVAAAGALRDRGVRPEERGAMALLDSLLSG